MNLHPSLLAFLLLFLWPPTAARGADALDAATRARLQTAFRKIRDVYRHVNGGVHHSSTVDTKLYSYLNKNRPFMQIDPTTKAVVPFDKPIFTTTERDLTFAIDGPLKRYQSRSGSELFIDAQTNPATFIVTPKPRRNPIAGSGACAGESYFFLLKLPDLGGKPVLTEFEPTERTAAAASKSSTEDIRAEYDDLFQKKLGVALYSPWLFYHMDLSELFDDPKFLVTSVEPITHHGHSCSRYTFEHETFYVDKVKKTKRIVRSTGWFISCPREGHALHEALVNSRGGIGRKPFYLQIEYEGEADGVPIVHLVRDGYAGGPVTDVYEFKSLRFGPSPKSEFTLAAFGLPEVESPLAASTRAPARTSFVPILAAASVVSLAVAVVLKRKSRRPDLKGA